MKILLALSTALFIAPQIAWAQSSADTCRKMTSDSERLKCFDEALKPAPASESKGAWRVVESKDDLTGKPDVTLSLLSTRAKVYHDSFRPDATAALYIRCMAGSRPSLAFSFGNRSLVANKEVDVEYRIGSAGPQKVRWDAAQGDHGYGPFNRPDALKMIRSMIDQPDLFLKGDTHIYGTSDAMFDITGLKAAIEPHRKACGF